MTVPLRHRKLYPTSAMPKRLVTSQKLAGTMVYLAKHITTGSPERWKRAYKEKGKEGLINSKPCPENPKLRTPLPLEEMIIYIRKTYHFGQKRIIRTADAVVSTTLP